jgi:hypothetical protein
MKFFEMQLIYKHLSRGDLTIKQKYNVAILD